MDDSTERPLVDLLDSLAARTPAPGGGSAAAWTAAIAAALLEMAAAFAGSDDTAQQAAALRGRLIAEGELELHSYEPVLAALRAPASDPSRKERLARALSEASEAPLAIARASTEVAELAAVVAEHSDRALRGDAITGVLLAEAAACAAAQLVEINLYRQEEDPRRTEAVGLAKRAASARTRALG